MTDRMREQNINQHLTSQCWGRVLLVLWVVVVLGPKIESQDYPPHHSYSLGPVPKVLHVPLLLNKCDYLKGEEDLTKIQVTDILANRVKLWVLHFCISPIQHF